MLLGNPYQQYKEQALSTLAPGELLVRLYDELVKQLMIAKIKLSQSDLASVNNALGKSQTIVTTLADSLDMRYPISKELRDMYIFIAQHLMQANLKKDADLIDDCIPLVRDLRDSFAEADKINRKMQRTASIPAGGQAV